MAPENPDLSNRFVAAARIALFIFTCCAVLLVTGAILAALLQA
jgi:hypothetical protein